ncbi:MAG TPA: GGDEF domain-containing protein [Candidatus Rubrimentiphilum sp.]|nr:GGDEF domain-containing protein [Candidatus Rubrimentiphilum sp.]
MKMPSLHGRCREALRSERALLEAMSALTAASRDSAGAVLQTLGAVLPVLDPAIDAVLVFRPDGEELACAFSGGGRAEYFSGLRLRLDGSSLPARAARARHHVMLEPGSKPVIPTDRGALAIPMYVRNALCAVAYASARGSISARDALVRAAAHAAVPYTLARDREADRASATYDALTGLYTARAFRDTLQAELRAAAIGRSVTLALWFIDTDGFKGVNDARGHAAGDRVLQRLGSILREHLRPALDLGARNGGDEFCAVLRNEHKSGAIARAQRFCDAVRACDFGVGLPVTASVGVAAFPYDAAAASELFEAADAAMYHSKRSGRDRVAFPDGRGSFTVHR